MKTIVVSGLTYSMIADAAIYPFQSIGKVLEDGRIEVPVDDTVYAHIIDSALEGEDFDDTIQRLVKLSLGRPTYKH